MADVVAVGIPSTGETEKSRLPSENVTPPSDNVSPPSANVNSPPKTVAPPSENGSLPAGNVYLQPENVGPLAESTNPSIGNIQPPDGNRSLPNDHFDDSKVINKLNGAQIDHRAAEEESSTAAGGSIPCIVPSTLNEKGNTVESPKDCQTPVSHPAEDDCSTKFNNSAVSNHSKKGRPDSVISRSAVSTARHPTSYFLDGSLPSYALPTVAFQIRISLTTDNVSQDDVPTCHRYKSPSPLCHRHKRQRSRSLDNGLQLENGSKTDRSTSSQPWKSSTARPKGRTPLHSLPAGQKSTRGETESRPSSVRTDPSTHGPSVRSAFAKEKPTSDSNSVQLLKKNVVPTKSSQLSTSVTESVVTPGVKNTTAKAIDRPKSMTTSKESPVSDDFKLTKRPAWKQSAKTSPDKEFSSAHESGPKPRTMERVVRTGGSSTPTGDEKENGGKEVLSTSRESALKPSPDKVTSPTKAKHDRAPVRGTPKSAEDRNITASNKPALDTPPSIGKGPGSAKGTKQVTPVKTPSSETPTKVQHAKSSPTKEVLILTETRKDLSTPSKVHSKTQSGHNKNASGKKEPKKVPTPNREETSFGSLAGINKEVKGSAGHHDGHESNHHPIKSPAIEKDKAKGVATEKTCATAESPGGAPQKEKESPMDEYRAKLAENRKMAREKAEHEAEEERMRDVQQRLAEEERKRQEEEDERRRDEEEMRLAEELRRLEEERYRKSVEETELRRREEAERIEAEAKAKAEQEILAKEEAVKLEKMRQEKMKREEEEKQSRKKRLEQIMKRVKADETVTKVEARNTTEEPPSDITLNQSMERSSLDSSILRDTISPMSQSDDSTTHFKSPLLQQLLTGRAKTQAVVVGNFLDADKKSTKSETTPETMSCLYEEQKSTEEPSRIILSQEMAS